MGGAIASIPGPKGHPVLGMAGELRRDLLGTLTDGFRRYGDIVRYSSGPAWGPGWVRRDVVAVHNPEGVRRVLTDERVFTRETASFRVLRELFGENIATARGDRWRRQRHTIQPLFAAAQVERYADVMQAEAREALRAERASGVVDIARLMESYTVRVLGRTLFGDGQGIDQTIADALARLVPVIGSLVQARASGALRLPLPWPTASNRRFLRLRTALYEVVDRVLAGRPSDATEACGDLIGRLQATRDDGASRSFTVQDIRNQALIFLLAGHTTTTSALTSIAYLLARHPEVQQRVADAVASSCTPHEACDLARAAVRESLRLYPPAHVIGRRVLSATQIDRHALAAGTNVLVSPWVTHRDPRYWPDPDRFEPERFLGASPPRYAYFPFGGGRRVCIGRHFALLEAMIMVRELLRAYKLEAVDSELSSAQLITLRPSGPVRVRWDRR